MVPIPDSSYFPPLENCLNGEELLMYHIPQSSNGLVLTLCSSWKTVFTSLSKHDELLHSSCHPRLEQFLNDPYVLQLLARPYNPYSFSTTQAKSSFETKTAAINITPTTKGRYSISEIKEDALWLSKEAQVDELSALRLMTLEFQNRSAAQLVCNFTEEESASLQEAGGNGPEALSLIAIGTLSSGNLSTFDSQDSRRIRALRLYISERQYLLKCTGILLQAGLNQKWDAEQGSSDNSARDGASNIQERWMDSIGKNVFESIRQTSESVQGFLIYSIRSIKMSFTGLDKGSGWLMEHDGKEELEIDWLGSKIIEAVHTMEIIFSIVDSQDSIPSSDSVLEWFRFVATYGFFDEFNSVCLLQ